MDCVEMGCVEMDAASNNCARKKMCQGEGRGCGSEVEGADLAFPLGKKRFASTANVHASPGQMKPPDTLVPWKARPPSILMHNYVEWFQNKLQASQFHDNNLESIIDATCETVLLHFLVANNVKNHPSLTRYADG